MLRDDALLASVFGGSESEVVSQLVAVEMQGRSALVHQKALAAFERAARAIEGSAYRIVEAPETYSYRVIHGRQLLSLHAYGIAVDINPSANPSCGVSQTCRATTTSSPTCRRISSKHSRTLASIGAATGSRIRTLCPSSGPVG